MATRILAVTALALALGSIPASAQGRQQQIVLSPSVLKSLAAHKPKSKTPLTVRLGMLRRAPASTVAPSPSAHPAPTSVSRIRQTPAHR
jgi:hypothetical protein